MELRTALALTSPLMVAAASHALEGGSLDSFDAWMQIAESASVIAGIILIGFIVCAETINKDDEKFVSKFFITMGAVFTCGAYSWVILSKDGTKDIRHIFMDKTLHKEAGKAFSKICATLVTGLFFMPSK